MLARTEEEFEIYQVGLQKINSTCTLCKRTKKLFFLYMKIVSVVLRFLLLQQRKKKSVCQIHMKPVFTYHSTFSLASVLDVMNRIKKVQLFGTSYFYR